MQTLRLGLAGCGNWGRLILRALVQLGAEVTVLARSAESRRNAAEHGAAAVVGTLDELLAGQPAGCVVASPSTTHGGIVARILEGTPRTAVFCEKPLTVDAAAARALLPRGRDRVFVMDKWRYHEGVLELARLARQRTFGEVLGLRTERLGWGSRNDEAGTVWHLMPHDVAIALEILGEVPALRWAHVQRAAGRVTGATAVLGSEPWFECRVSSHHPLRIRRVQLVCRDAVVSLDDGYADALVVSTGPLDAGDRAPEQRRLPIATTLPLHAELAAFVAFLRGEGPPPKTALPDAVTIVERIEQVVLEGSRHAGA